MVILVLGGCGSRYAFMPADAGAPAAPAVPAVESRGTPVPPQAVQVLESAPAGARLDYRQPNGAPVVAILGEMYQSGLQVPCRMGRSGGGSGRGDSPQAFVFCRHGNQWYAMPPVVISGL
jgi:hypothetical protein